MKQEPSVCNCFLFMLHEPGHKTALCDANVSTPKRLTCLFSESLIVFIDFEADVIKRILLN